MKRQFTAIIEQEGDMYVALCPDLDIASQGESVEQARDNLKEALALFFEDASPEEVAQRWQQWMIHISPGKAEVLHIMVDAG